jgi:hypothetical protein
LTKVQETNCLTCTFFLLHKTELPKGIKRLRRAPAAVLSELQKFFELDPSTRLEQGFPEVTYLSEPGWNIVQSIILNMNATLDFLPRQRR